MAEEQLKKWTRKEGEKPRIFSGMQPTGELHIGNYLGALKNWIELANDGSYDPIYCIVDYHAITVPYNPDEMQKKIFDMALVMLASGLPADKCTLFVQSHVPQHTELAWVFNSMAMIGRLENMTQFKDKAKLAENKGGVNAGLFTYPILQAADILLYKGELVPVGEDQAQHLELTREIARRFNHRFGSTFPEPKTMFSATPRIMGLDGERKMSKSLGNHIGLLEDPDSITEKLTRRSSSDPSRKRLKDPGDPDKCYVFSLHKFFSSPEEQMEIASACRNATIGCFECKKRLAQKVIETTEPIRERAEELKNHPDDIKDVLKAGAKRCLELASETMHEVKSKMGLIPDWAED